MAHTDLCSITRHNLHVINCANTLFVSPNVQLRIAFCLTQDKTALFCNSPSRVFPEANTIIRKFICTVTINTYIDRQINLSVKQKFMTLHYLKCILEVIFLIQ